MKKADIKPVILGIIMTHKCPAECRSCGYECSPKQNEVLTQKEIFNIIDQACKISSIKLIAFMGGEPFLFKERLKNCIKHANLKGFLVRCVTNAFWASSIAKTRKILDDLKKAGLTTINVSCDDFHQEYIPFKNIENVYKSALELAYKNKIFVLGISQGTIIGANLAIKDKDIAGLILMSSSPRDFRDALRYQFVEREIKWLSFYDANQDEKFSKEEVKRLPAFFDFPFETLDINHDNFVDQSELRALVEIQFYNNIIFSEMYKKDDLPMLMEVITKVKSPILFLHGGKDEQTPLFDLYSFIYILEQSKNNNFQYKIFPELGHCFSPPVKYDHFEMPTRGPIQKDVLEYIYQWLKLHI